MSRSTLKSIGVGAGFLLPASVIAVGLVYVFIFFDYAPDPGAIIGGVLWGSWAIMCGFYFRSKRFKIAGAVLLIFAATDFVLTLGSLEGNTTQEMSIELLDTNVDPDSFAQRSAFEDQLVSAQNGNLESALWLAEKYNSGSSRFNIEQNYPEAVIWYRLASDKGSAVAQNELGEIYRMGLGVLQDYVEAFLLFRSASSLGNLQAQMNLANAYAHGEGVAEDPVLAHMWYNIVASRTTTVDIRSSDFIGSPVIARGSLERTMRDDQLQESKRKATLCLESEFTDCE